LVREVRFTRAIKKKGYNQSQADHTLFIKHSLGGKLSILIVYVNDIIVTWNDNSEMNNLKEMLANEFEIKNLGNLRYFLGMEVVRLKREFQSLKGSIS